MLYKEIIKVEQVVYTTKKYKLYILQTNIFFMIVVIQPSKVTYSAIARHLKP